ncbi:MAG: MBL fold metallo-hydrolase [Myxococcota bacterium]
MRVAVLASGSSGNCTYVEAAGARLLIDAGISTVEIARRLARVPRGPRLEQIDAVLLTHEHADHVASAWALAARGLRVYATEGTRVRAGLAAALTVVPGRRFEVGEVAVTPVRVPHDAAEPVGYVVEGEGARIGLLTDCGHVTAEIEESFATLDLLVLESNHAERLLRGGPYPASLKRRIGSRLGHLSNEQAARLLRAFRRGMPRALVLAHLSRVNNRPMLARAAAAEAFGRRSIPIAIAHARGCAVGRIHRGAIDFDAVPAGRQLELFS